MHYSLKTFLPLALLPLVANAYTLKAYTDTECSEGEKDLSADDPSGNGYLFPTFPMASHLTFAETMRRYRIRCDEHLLYGC